MKLWLGRKSTLAIIATLFLLGTLSVTAGVLAYGPQQTADLLVFLAPHGLGGGKILRMATGVPMNDASVTTDKGEYSPGQIVHITGGGFMGGENVQLQVTYVVTDKPANRPELPDNV